MDSHGDETSIQTVIANALYNNKYISSRYDKLDAAIDLSATAYNALIAVGAVITLPENFEIELECKEEIPSYKKPYADAGHDVKSLFDAMQVRCSRCGVHQVLLSQDLERGSIRPCNHDDVKKWFGPFTHNGGNKPDWVPGETIVALAWNPIQYQTSITWEFAKKRKAAADARDWTGTTAFFIYSSEEEFYKINFDVLSDKEKI